ncbi:MAG: endolytic transglycosylase MltG [Candidatus Paceibacterota bacterium]
MTIEKGENLRSVSLKLKNENIIRSRLAFEAMAIMRGGELRLMYSHYLFDSKLPVYEIVRRIKKGEHRIPQIKVTIPEGFSNSEIADMFLTKLLAFDKNKFLADASSKEGYLFPDTYFFFATGSADDVLKIMADNYEKKIMPLREEIFASGKTEEQIIIMASIIEGEAKGDADRETISGILWKRLNMNMPLQVDVVPETYKTRGLPDSPISNPGLKSIMAAIYPANSIYLYYLHDKSGRIHYAKTFAEHRANIVRYLK